MKTNYRRKNPDTGGFDYSHLNYCARRRAGLSMDHDGGHKGSARDIKEAKTHYRRQRRCIEKREVLSKLTED
jgi:hypothetical protein